MDIEWDPAKARSNIQKHGISFTDVEPAFFDQLALSMRDELSSSEERYVLIGRDGRDRVVTICYTYRGDSIRVISARPATTSERRDYEKGIRLS